MKPIWFLMIKLFAVFFCLSFLGCATLKKPSEPAVSKKEKIPFEAKEIAEPEIDPNAPFKISKVAISRKSFNPTKGEAVTISWHVSRSSKALIQIFDPDMGLVRELMPEDTGNPGFCEVSWDRRDMHGNRVPDEAYFFTIEANDYKGKFTHYDPVTFSGGDNIGFSVEFDKNKEIITYELPQDARITIRAGITHGPLLKKILDCRPRLAGENEESWDRKDASGIIYIPDQKGFTMMFDAVTLPENSMVSIGNPEYTYFEYKNEIAPDRPLKEERPRIAAKQPHADLQVEPCA